MLIFSIAGLFFFVFILGGLATYHQMFPYSLIKAVAEESDDYNRQGASGRRARGTRPKG